MPSGKVHGIATLGTGALVAGAMTYYGFPPAEIAACSVGFLTSLWVNPDLDLDLEFPKNKPSRWPWWVLWFPYSRLFGHRSFWSHTPVIGTALRVAYLILVIAALAWLLNIQLYGNVSLYWMLYGLALSDIVHGLLDAIVTVYKESVW